MAPLRRGPRVLKPKKHLSKKYNEYYFRESAAQTSLEGFGAPELSASLTEKAKPGLSSL